MPQKLPVAAGRTGKFVLMALGLGIIGALFAVAGALIGGKVLRGDASGFGALGLAIGGVLLGYPAGIIVGIILLKKILHQRGSLLSGILGSINGAVIIMALAEPLNLNSNTTLLSVVFLAGVPVFALAGFLLKK